MVEHDKRTPGERDHPAFSHRLAAHKQVGLGGVESNFPAGRRELVGNSKLNRLVMGVEQKEKVVVIDMFARAITYFRGISPQKHAKGAHPSAILPVAGFHFLPVRSKPFHVFTLWRSVGIGFIKTAAMKIRVLAPILNDSGSKFEKGAPPFVEVPV